MSRKWVTFGGLAMVCLAVGCTYADAGDEDKSMDESDPSAANDELAPSEGEGGATSRTSKGTGDEAGGATSEPATSENVAQTSEALANQQYAVGILPYDVTGGNALCPTGMQRVSINWDAENPSKDSGWVTPSTSWPADNINLPYNVQLNFCEVNGENFKPIKNPATGNWEPYALLKLGNACPPQSYDASRQIDIEDDNHNLGGSGMPTTAGDISPNAISVFSITFKFCVFNTPAPAGTTMTSFPNLGVPYGVFHDFDAAQPSWAVAKRYVWSNDEDYKNQDSRYGGTFATAFNRMIEGTTDTWFEIAQVR